MAAWKSTKAHISPASQAKTRLIPCFHKYWSQTFYIAFGSNFFSSSFFWYQPQVPPVRFCFSVRHVWLLFLLVLLWFLGPSAAEILISKRYFQGLLRNEGTRPEKAILFHTPCSFSKPVLSSFLLFYPRNRKINLGPRPMSFTARDFLSVLGPSQLRETCNKVVIHRCQSGSASAGSPPGDEEPLVSRVCLSVCLSASRNHSVAKHRTHSCSYWPQCQIQDRVYGTLNSRLLCIANVQQRFPHCVRLLPQKQEVKR